MKASKLPVYLLTFSSRQNFWNNFLFGARTEKKNLFERCRDVKFFSSDLTSLFNSVSGNVFLISGDWNALKHFIRYIYPKHTPYGNLATYVAWHIGTGYTKYKHLWLPYYNLYLGCSVSLWGLKAGSHWTDFDRKKRNETELNGRNRKPGMLRCLCEPAFKYTIPWIMEVTTFVFSSQNKIKA